MNELIIFCIIALLYVVVLINNKYKFDISISIFPPKIEFHYETEGRKESVNEKKEKKEKKKK